jgi:hypothetical protein
MKKKSTKVKSKNKNQNVIPKKKDIKYSISNTQLTTIISKSGEIIFVVDEKYRHAAAKNDQVLIDECNNKLKASMEYLVLEGFIEKDEVLSFSSL